MMPCSHHPKLEKELWQLISSGCSCKSMTWEIAVQQRSLRKAATRAHASSHTHASIHTRTRKAIPMPATPNTNAFMSAPAGGRCC